MSYRAYQRDGFISLDLCDDHALALEDLPAEIAGWKPVAGAGPVKGCDACRAGGLQDAYLVAQKRQSQKPGRASIARAA